MALKAFFLVIFLALPLALATDYPIDWTLGPDYSTWTTKSVNVGDKLVFTYDSTHTVDVVDKETYDKCSGGKTIQTNTKSPTTITLTEGTQYIICGVNTHCNGGMKLQVTAKASGSSPAPSGGVETPTPTSTSPPTTPAGSGSGASTAGPLMLATSVALGALFAFLG